MDVRDMKVWRVAETVCRFCLKESNFFLVHEYWKGVL